MDKEARAANVLDRLDDCQNGSNVNESDILGTSTSDGFLEACRTLAKQVVHASGGLENKGEVISVARLLEGNAWSTRGEGCSRDVDASLVRLACVVNHEDACSGRIEAMEKLLNFVQASRIVAWRSGTVSKGNASRALRELQAGAEIKCDCNSAIELLNKVQEAARKAVTQLPIGFLDPLVCKEDLSGDQLDVLGEIVEQLTKQYTVQRRVLIERASLTLQSFLWSKRLEAMGTVDEVKQIVDQGLMGMSPEPSVSVSQLFTTNLGDVIDVSHRATCGRSTTFKASVKGVMIGEVPDRGGRPDGRSTNDSNMPKFSKRITEESGRGGRRGGRHSTGGRGGGRVQGGWQSGRGGGHKRGKHSRGKYR